MAVLTAVVPASSCRLPLLIVLLAMSSTLLSAQAGKQSTPRYTTRPFNASANIDFAATCTPSDTGVAGGQGTVEIIDFYNCSVYSQQLNEWPTTAVPYQQFLQNLPNASSPTNGLWGPNPSGIRYVTMTYQCFFGSPGCTSRYTSPLQVGIEAGNNYGPWYALGNGCAGGWGGGCVSANCTSESMASPGDIKLVPNSKCANLQWSYPLPLNTQTIATLEDPVGNIYIHHAFNTPEYIFPTSGLPPGWRYGNITMTPDSEPIIIQPLRPTGQCNNMGDPATVGCIYMLAQDSAKNSYHRVYWSGQEPDTYPIVFPFPTAPERPAACQDVCNAAKKGKKTKRGRKGKGKGRRPLLA